MKKFAKKSTVFAIILSLTLGTAGTLGVNLSNAATTYSSTMDGSGQYVFESVADSATNTVPSEFGTPAADGRVWTDKTVKVNANDSGISTSYNITLSALAQEYKYDASEIASGKGPADVLMILDFTGSMHKNYVSIDEEYAVSGEDGAYSFANDPQSRKFTTMSRVNNARLTEAKKIYQSAKLSSGELLASRIDVTTIAVNKAMDIIMSANPDNRIEIDCYNTECECFAPLASYKPGIDGAYVVLDYSTDKTNTFMVSASGLKSRTSASDNYAEVSLKSKSVSGDTHTQYGIAQACNHFVNESLGDANFGGQDRTPFVLFMTDGHSLMSSEDWYNNPPSDNKKYYTAEEDEDREDVENKSYKKDNDYAVSALTVLTAAYQKKLIQDKYRSQNLNNDSTTEVQWYNIGIGVDPIQDVTTAKCFQLMLDPSKISNTSKIFTYLNNYIVSKPDYIGISDIAYCEGGCVSFVDTPNTIRAAFNNLGDAVADSSGDTVLPIKSTITGGGVFVTFTDILGTGTKLAKAKGKSYYDVSLTLGEATYKALPDETDSNLYYFYYDAGSKSGKMSSTVTIDEDKNSLTWKIDAGELPIIKFANRAVPGTELDGVVYISAAPIELTYDVELTSEGTDTIYSKEKDKTANNKVYSNAFDSGANASAGSTTATFTPKEQNAYYYNSGTKNAAETAVDKVSEGNLTSSASTASSYGWNGNDYVVSLGNNGRAQGIAKVEISSDKSSYKQGDEIVYTVKVTNISDIDIKGNSNQSRSLLRIYLPECAEYVSASDGISLSSDETNRYAYLTVNKGKSKTYTLTAKINDQDPSDAEARATIDRINTVKTINLAHPAVDKADIDVEYELNYDLQGGSFTGSVDNPKTYSVDDSLTLATPTLDGCTFAGWKVKAQSGSWAADTVFGPDDLSLDAGNYGNVTLVAQWNAKYSYNAMEHGKVQLGTNTSASTDSETIDAVNGAASTVKAVPDPGYYFDGWYSDSSCTTKVSDSVSFTPTKADTNDANIKAYKNGTYYAKFSPVLSIEKTASTESTTVLPGNKITYTIKIKNNTDKALSEIYVKDVIPSGLGSLNFSFNGTGKAYTVSCDNLMDKTTSEKVFKISEIAAGKSAEFEFSVLISEGSTAKSFTNTAKVTSFKYDGSKIEEFNPEASATTDVSEHVKVVYHFVDKPDSVDDSTGKDSLLPATDFIAIDNAYTSKKKGRDTIREIACKGYSFDYWYTDQACTTKYSDGTVLTSSNTTGGVLNLYGKWTKNVYDIEYVLDGGEFKKDGSVIANPNPATYSIDTSTFTLTNPTKTGHTFAGWTGTGLSAASTEVSVATGSTGNRKYTATWTKNSNAVTFDSNGHGNKVDGIPKLDYGEKVTKPTDPSATGYTFGGWYKEPECKNAWNFDTDTMPDEPLVLYAKWTADEYTITYDLDDGIFKDASEATIENPNAKKYTIETESFTLTNPTKQGYTFAGWTGTELSVASSSVTIAHGSTGDRSYKATWLANTNTKYDVKHYQQNLNDDKYTLFETENKTGTTAEDTDAQAKTYEGFTAGSVTQKKIEPDGSTVVEIYYTRNSYEVSYVFKNTPTGASACPTGGSYKYGETIQLAADATAPNYKFGGWTQKKASESEKSLDIETAEDKTKSFKMPANDITLEGEFVPVEYTIEYVLNGGSVEGNNPGKYTVESDAITLINPTRKGYTFDGWTGGVKDKAAEVTDDKNVKINKGSTGDRKYTANWTPIEYSITYKLDDGIFRDSSGDKIDNPNAKTYTAETSSFTLSNPTKKGYTFNGWTGTGLDKATMVVTIAKGSTGDREYTATWVKNNNAVTFDTNGHGGSVPGIAELDYGEKVSKPDDPEADGYIFGGWYKEPGCKTAWDFDTDTMPDCALVLYAKWIPIEYTITYDLDGGSVDGTNPTRYTVESADITLINPSREGYTFLGWTGTELSDASTSVTIAHGSTGNRAYKAIWKGNDVGVKYDAPAAGPYDAKDPKFTTPHEDNIPLNDGIIVNPNSGEWKHGDKTYTEATEIIITGGTTIDKPTRDGYIFMGWEKSTEGGKIKLTATWEPDRINAGEGKPDKADNIPDIYQKKVIFKVKNGVWKDGSKKDIILIVNLINETGEFDPNGTAEIEIPEGMKPNKGFKRYGSWNTEPQTIVSGTGELVYIYTFEPKHSTNPAGGGSDDDTASGRAKTGDATDIESVVLYAGGGILALLMAAWLLRQKLR